MNIRPYRSSFTIYILDKQMERADEILLAVKSAGYQAKAQLSSDKFFDDLTEDPPHIVLIEQDTLIVVGESFIEQCLAKLPEVHIIVYSEKSEIFSAHPFFEQGVYDCVAYSPGNFNFIIRAADRASEYDYFRYMNEQLQSRASKENYSSSTDYEVHATWLKDLAESRSLKEAIDKTLTELSRYSEKGEVIYFKYIPSHRSLVASQSIVADVKKIRGMGFDLAKEEIEFTAELLFKPNKLDGLKKLLETALQIKKYDATPLIVQGVPEGVFVFVNAEKKWSLEPYIQTCIRSLGLKVAQLNLTKRMNTVASHDEKTRVYNRENFIELLKKEISRSRRITQPVTLCILSIDEFDKIEKRLTDYEADLLLKMSASILRRHSRINDIIGRIGKNEFGIILPHTGKLGGAIKGERLRRIFESADFSKIVPSSNSLTVSLGISEYPSHCRDTDEILTSADEARLEVLRTGANKVCLASAPEGFIPDFILDGTKL